MTQSKPMMTFVNAVKQCFRKYGDFSGRATRAEYWWWQLFGWIGAFVFGVVDSSIVSLIVSLIGGVDVFSPFGTVFGLAILLPGLAVTARRLHDIGKTGWWLLAWFIVFFLGTIPFILGIVLIVLSVIDIMSYESTNFTVSVILILIGLLVWLIAIIWWLAWMIRQGQTGPNRYGPDPRAWEDEEPVLS